MLKRLESNHNIWTIWVFLPGGFYVPRLDTAPHNVIVGGCIDEDSCNAVIGKWEGDIGD